MAKEKKMTAQQKAELEQAMNKFAYDHVAAFQKKVAKDAAAAGYCPMCVAQKVTCHLVQCFGVIMDELASCKGEEKAKKEADAAAPKAKK